MVEVSDVPEEQRYVLTVDGRRAGLLDYRISGADFAALHVEVDAAMAGRGLGSELVRQVLDEVRTSGRRLLPQCPFVVHYLHEHPEYADLVGGTTPGAGAA